jgi:hypothetical protein
MFSERKGVTFSHNTMNATSASDLKRFRSEVALKVEQYSSSLWNGNGSEQSRGAIAACVLDRPVMI